MPRGKNQNQDSNHRARGGGRGRGRGRGGPHPGIFTTPSRAPGTRHPYPHSNAEIDVVIQQWSDASVVPDTNWGGNVNRGYVPWRGRGGTPRSRSGAGTPLRGAIQNATSFRRGTPTPRGRGRGRGLERGWDLDEGRDSHRRRTHFGVGSKGKRSFIGKDAPLSELLYSERPLLRPVKFVRATLTPFLFQHSEDVMKPAGDVIDDTETSHVPTADRVAQLFHQTAAPLSATSGSDSGTEDGTRDALEEIDFADLAQIRAEVDAIARATATADLDAYQDEEELEEVDFADLAAMRAKIDAAEPLVTYRNGVVKESEVFTGAYNRVEGEAQASSSTGVVFGGQINGLQQTTLLSGLSTLDDRKPSLSSTPIVASEEIRLEKVPRSCPSMLMKEPSQPPASPPNPESLLMEHHSDIPPPTDHHPLFTIDTAPTHPLTERSASDVVLVDRTGHGKTLGDQEDELIVYVAPHPRSRLVSSSPVPTVPHAKFPQTSMLTGRVLDAGLRDDDDGVKMSVPDRGGGGEGVDEDDHHLAFASLSLGPTPSTSMATTPPHTNEQGKSRKKNRRQRRRQNKRDGRSGVYDTVTPETRLKEEDARERQRPLWETRRRGDSDVDWGTEDGDGDGGRPGVVEGDDGDGVDAVSDGLGGMEIDPDLDIDVEAMQGFLKSMSAEGSRFVTMDDIEDEARMQRDEEQASSDSECGVEEVGDEDEDEGEEEQVFDLEEQLLIAESDGEELPEDSEDDDDDDDELSPKSSFQARLRRIRERSRGQHLKTVQDTSDDEEDTPEVLPWTRSADDEEFIAHINDLIEENSEILAGRDRKQKKALFRNLHQGYVDEWDVEAFLDDPEFTTPVNKKKGTKGKGRQLTGYFSAELEAQWDKDRAKKAEWKRERQRARLLAALDPPSGTGRVSRKARRMAAHLNPKTAVSGAPGLRAVVNVVSLEAQMRRFAREGDSDEDSDDDSARLVLPPMDKVMRRVVHEMANAFGIKSVSAGKEGARYTTLIRTERTGVGVKEGKVRALMKRFQPRVGGKTRVEEGRVPRHREGDEVGKEAPKIGENNVGFRMLASMGWSEGHRIGSTASVGLEVPLTAIIKNSKRGLGATR